MPLDAKGQSPARPFNRLDHPVGSVGNGLQPFAERLDCLMVRAVHKYSLFSEPAKKKRVFLKSDPMGRLVLGDLLLMDNFGRNLAGKILIERSPQNDI